MSEVLVIGHRNPDTDAICSAIGYAEFKRRTGMRDVVAARCGDTNEQIDFVLRKKQLLFTQQLARVASQLGEGMYTVRQNPCDGPTPPSRGRRQGQRTR
jgi:inorganic pyrophosphatase/exopolyphosphatase